MDTLSLDWFRCSSPERSTDSSPRDSSRQLFTADADLADAAANSGLAIAVPAARPMT